MQKVVGWIFCYCDFVHEKQESEQESVRIAYDITWFAYNTSAHICTEPNFFCYNLMFIDNVDVF